MRLSAKVTVFCWVVALAPAAIAQQEHGSGHQGHAGMGDMPGMGGPAEPGHGSSAWAELNSVRDAISRLVASGKLAEVHNQAERLAPLGQALSDGAKSLPAEKRKRIEATLRQLPELGKTLDKAGDAGDAEATRRELKRLDGVIALIQAQYPADVLSKVPAPGGIPAKPKHSESGPAGHEHVLIVAAPDGKGDWIHLHAMANATDSGTFQIDQPGTNRVLCTVPGHTEAGMVGELVVR